MVKKAVPVRLMSAIFFSFLLVGTASAAPPMNPGQWQVTIKTEMPGIPVPIPPITQTHCLTEEDMVPQKGEPGQNCKTVDYNVSGSKVTWRMICTGDPGETESRGEITYSGDTFKGSAKTTVDVPGQGQMTMTNQMNGKRIGSCTK